MNLPLDGTPVEAWAVQRDTDTDVFVHYVCSTQAQATQLAFEYRAQTGKDCRVVPLSLTATRRTYR